MAASAAAATTPEKPIVVTATTPEKPIAVASTTQENPIAGDVTTPEKPIAVDATTPEKPIAVDATTPPATTEKKSSYFKAAAALISSSISFKEESNVVADLEDPEKKALDELKILIANHDFTAPPPAPAAKSGTDPAKTDSDVKTPAKSGSESPIPPKTDSDSPPPAKTDPDTPIPAEKAADDVAEAKDDVIPADPAVAVSIDDDGAKTVEAIAESVVAVTLVPEQEKLILESAETVPESVKPAEPVSIWGVPLIGDARSDTVLLKFLRARDFKPSAAFTMLKNAVAWTKVFKIDSLLTEDLGVPEFEKAVFMSGVDREGHPVCYNVYGEFQDKDLYAKAFGDAEKRERFLRWRIQFLEKGIREVLDLSSGGVSSMVQVTDLKNSPGLMRRELGNALQMLQDNYPEFAAKQVLLNAPWWYLAFNQMISPFLSARTKSKFVVAGPSASVETLFKYIAPAQVPVRFGGLSIENNSDFTSADVVTETALKPAVKEMIEIPVTEAGVVVVELRVVGWEVVYGAEFVPSAEDSYTMILQKGRKVAAEEETVVKSSFKIGEAGKVVLTIDNSSGKKKVMLHRYKVKSLVEEKEKN